MADTKRTDDVTGYETTGHEWDGIEELNRPLPKWWVYVFYATIVWSIGYWIAMPAWPLVSDYTKGMLGYSQRETVAAQIEEARAGQKEFLDRIAAGSLQEIRDDDDLRRFAIAGGSSAFGDNCAACHGSGAQGFVGYPNLNDDEWIWGGTLDDIHTTLLYGIRAAHDDTRVNDMPAFGRDEILTRAQISDVADYVLSLSTDVGDTEAVERGQAIYAEQCVACHKEDASGNKELGSPNLKDAIWLYGGDKEAIVASITNSRRGVMPGWIDRLDETTIKQLTIYVHTLGGGEDD